MNFGHELWQTLGQGEGQGNLACVHGACFHGICPWDHKESDMTKCLNNNRLLIMMT